MDPLLRCLGYVCGLRTFLAFGDLEIDLIAFLETLIAFGADRAVVNKYVRSICAPDEPVSFSIVEPFDSSVQSFH